MNVSKSRMLSFLMMCVTILTGASHEEKSLIPKEMVYIGHGPSVMGMDRGKRLQTQTKNRRRTSDG